VEEWRKYEAAHHTRLVSGIWNYIRRVLLVDLKKAPTRGANVTKREGVPSGVYNRKMSVQKILERLEHVRKVSGDQWVAVCPSHDDRSPSLHVREKDDGRILIHCKAGCGATEVLDSIGLTYNDLFPDSGTEYRAFSRVKDHTVDDFVVEIWNADRKLGRKPSKADKERYRQALMRGGKETGWVDEILDNT